LAPIRDFQRVFATLHLVHDATMAVASVGEMLGTGSMLADRRLLAAIRLIP
jgi:hypothetical protein